MFIFHKCKSILIALLNKSKTQQVQEAIVSINYCFLFAPGNLNPSESKQSIDLSIWGIS